MKKTYEKLKTRMGEICALSSASGLLSWDQHTYMPASGAAVRAQVQGALSAVAHEKLIAPDTGAMIDELYGWAREQGPDSDEFCVLRRLKMEYDRKIRLPQSFVREFATEASVSMAVWQEARLQADYKMFLPHFEKLVRMCRDKADMIGFSGSPYDALADEFEPGITTASLEKSLGHIKRELVPFFHNLRQNGRPVDDSILHKRYDEEQQMRLAGAVVGELGFDFTRGRQDKSAHPFTSSFSCDDVRITTRTAPDYLPVSLYAAIHECGHAFYEQGVPEKYAMNFLRGGSSLAMHESQSRIWENLVARTRPASGWLLGKLREFFPVQAAHTGPEEFYRAVNKSSPTLIRTEADEITYNFHILLRFEIEKGLIEGGLSAADVPAVWNAKMKEYIGITPANDAEGALQDVHWSLGLLGYFPAYMLGDVMAAQFMSAARRQLPQLDTQFAHGEFSAFHKWLHENIHRHGAKYTSDELLKKVTGRGLDADALVRHIRAKYSEIYGLSEVCR